MIHFGPYKVIRARNSLICIFGCGCFWREKNQGYYVFAADATESTSTRIFIFIISSNPKENGKMMSWRIIVSKGILG